MLSTRTSSGRGAAGGIATGLTKSGPDNHRPQNHEMGFWFLVEAGCVVYVLPPSPAEGGDGWAK